MQEASATAEQNRGRAHTWRAISFLLIPDVCRIIVLNTKTRPGSHRRPRQFLRAFMHQHARDCLTISSSAEMRSILNLFRIQKKGRSCIQFTHQHAPDCLTISSSGEMRSILNLLRTQKKGSIMPMVQPKMSKIQMVLAPKMWGLSPMNHP